LYYLAVRQTDTQTDAAKRFTAATVVGVSNEAARGGLFSVFLSFIFIYLKLIVNIV